MATLSSTLNPRLLSTPRYDFNADVYRDPMGLYTADLRVQKEALAQLNQLVTDQGALSNKGPVKGPQSTIRALKTNSVLFQKAARIITAIQELTAQIKAENVPEGVDGSGLDVTTGKIETDAQVRAARERLQAIEKIKKTFIDAINTLQSVEITAVPLLQRSFSSKFVVKALQPHVDKIEVRTGTTVGEIESAVLALSVILEESSKSADKLAQEILSYQPLDISDDVEKLQKQKKTISAFALFNREKQQADIDAHNAKIEAQIRQLKTSAYNTDIALAPFQAALATHQVLLKRTIEAKQAENKLQALDAIVRVLEPKEQTKLLNSIIPTLGLPHRIAENMLISEPKGIDPIELNPAFTETEDSSDDEGGAAAGERPKVFRKKAEHSPRLTPAESHESASASDGELINREIAVEEPRADMIANEPNPALAAQILTSTQDLSEPSDSEADWSDSEAE